MLKEGLGAVIQSNVQRNISITVHSRERRASLQKEPNQSQVLPAKPATSAGAAPFKVRPQSEDSSRTEEPRVLLRSTSPATPTGRGSTHSAMSGYPQEAATCSGVHPSLSAWFTLAWCSTRKDTISMLPSMQACVDHNQANHSLTPPVGEMVQNKWNPRGPMSQQLF